MAGILDSKSRILDTVITQEGKRQIANGGLRAVYATVSDKHSHYEYSAVSGSEDASKRIYTEAPTESINDSIVMESDDSGKLMGYPVQGDAFYGTDGLVSGRTSVSGTLTYATSENATGFNSLADSIVSSSLERFRNLYTVGTRTSEEPDNLVMEISPKTYTFTINNIFPFQEGPSGATSNVDCIDPLFFDELLANVINFQYLPPIKSPLVGLHKKSPSSPPRFKRFGFYTKFQRPTGLNLEKIMRQMNIMSGTNAITGDPDAVYDTGGDSGGSPFGKSGEATSGNYGLASSQENGSVVNLSVDQLARERVSVFFKKTSTTNNLMMQMFEVNSASSKLTKLDVIDFGFAPSPNEPRHPVKRIFFVGKVFINTLGLPAFVNLFTIIMD